MAASLAVSNDTNPIRPTREKIAFLLTFATKTVAPNHLPEFPYIAVAVSFDAIQFKAVVSAEDLLHASCAIKDLWPDARVIHAQAGEDFEFSPTTLTFVPLGMVPPPPPVYVPGVFVRMWRWMAGHGPVFKN
jgi:hypothetical protein